MKRSVSGFTIVELLIVIVVIAILAAISIVAYNGVRNRARTTSAQSAATNAAKTAQLYYTETGHYPARFSDLTGAASSDVYKLNGVSSVGTLSNETPENAILYAPCGTGSPASLAAITTANVSGALIYYRNYSDLNNVLIKFGATSLDTAGVLCWENPD